MAAYLALNPNFSIALPKKVDRPLEVMKIARYCHTYSTLESIALLIANWKHLLSPSYILTDWVRI